MYRVNQSLKFVIPNRHIFPGKLTHIRGNLVKIGQEVMCYSKSSNHRYMEFVGYNRCEKLIWTSGEDIIITNKTRKK